MGTDAAVSPRPDARGPSVLFPSRPCVQWFSLDIRNMRMKQNFEALVERMNHVPEFLKCVVPLEFPEPKPTTVSAPTHQQESLQRTPRDAEEDPAKGLSAILCVLCG